MRVHSLTFFGIPGSMKCDSHASFLARYLASPCLGREPEVRVATNLVFIFINMVAKNIWVEVVKSIKG